MQLRDWQQRFQDVVLGREHFDALPLHEQYISRELSMGIYANAYRERLHGALRENYRALHQLLGDSDFAELAYGFIAAHPPAHASIRWFGAELAEYLAKHAPYNGCPIFAEIARFEWALRHSLDAADAERIALSDLQTLSEEQWETFICGTHPSLTILHCAWNAPQVWRALDAGEEPPAPAQFDSAWFIYRDINLMTQWRSADALETQAIQLWSQGKSFGDVCEFFAEKIEDTDAAVAVAASFLRTWVEQGLLGFDFAQPTDLVKPKDII